MTTLSFHHSNCLHTDEEGTYWYIDKQGTLDEFAGFKSAKSFEGGPYRVIGCPANYRLITELYSRLSQQDNGASLYAGSPLVCKERSCAKSALNCISVLDVHSNLSSQWHKVTNKSFNTFLLLRSWQEEVFSDLTKTVYSHHCLKPHFEFLGIPMSYALQLISQIVEPRWFINPNRPMRTQALEAYFGLTPKAFEHAWQAGLGIRPKAATVRAAFLLTIVDTLGPDSCLDFHEDEDPKTRARKMCKRLLNYVFRNWLEEAGLKGYFDPQQFFNKYECCVDYYYRFGSKDA